MIIDPTQHKGEYTLERFGSCCRQLQLSKVPFSISKVNVSVVEKCRKPKTSV